MVNVLIRAVLLASVPGTVQAQTPAAEPHPAMADFAVAIRQATSGLATDDLEKLLSAARALSVATRQTEGLEPQAYGDLRETFDAYLQDLRVLSDDLVDQAEKNRTRPAAAALHEIRNTCVLCHTMFRPDIESSYPNLGNIIRGQVTIERADGEQRADRSSVVVFLDQAPERDLYRTSTTISQADRFFTPRVTAIVKGTTVNFPNDDVIFHNVFSLSKTRPFDLDIYPPGKSKSVTYERSGWAKVYCNIHPDMVAHVIVLDNSYFAITDINGNFTIPNVPDGDYRMRTWHEFAAGQKAEVAISGGVVEDVDFLIREDKRLRAHKDKFGKTYKAKY